MSAAAPEIALGTTLDRPCLARRIVVLLLAAGSWLCAPALANTPSTATASGLAAVQIVQPIALTRIDDLDFGIVASTGRGTVTVEAGSASASYGGSARAACTPAAPCPQAHPARFEIMGEHDRDYRITAPDLLRIPATGAARSSGDLLVTGFTVRTASQPGAGAKGRLDRLGRDRFELGGTLDLPAALPPGHYQVTVPVILTYD